MVDDFRRELVENFRQDGARDESSSQAHRVEKKRGNSRARNAVRKGRRGLETRETGSNIDAILPEYIGNVYATPVSNDEAIPQTVSITHAAERKEVEG